MAIDVRAPEPEDAAREEPQKRAEPHRQTLGHESQSEPQDAKQPVFERAAGAAHDGARSTASSNWSS
jgi:hypothetical protein